MIRIIGHEVGGHGLHFETTKVSNLPDLLKEASSDTIPYEESVAQFFERFIFDILEESTQTQNILGIQDTFPKMQEKLEARSLLDKYLSDFFYHTLMILSDPKYIHSGESIYDTEPNNRRIEALIPAALYPSLAINMVQKYVHCYDPTSGVLNFTSANEIRYAARPVERIIELYKKNGIDINQKGEDQDHFFETIYTGFWTSKGAIEWAKFRLSQYKQNNS